MKRLAVVASLALWIGTSALIGCGPSLAQDPAEKEKEKPAPGSGKDEKPKRVEKTDAEWQKLLPRDSYLVTRKKMTEPAGTGKYAHYKGKGVFACICCGNELFDARTKFESGTGWPSFYTPIAQDRIDTADDNSEAEARVEVMCAVCDAHLGHVFSDGPRPTGLRFCMNSAALKLVKPTAPAPKAKEKGDGAKSNGTAPKGKAKAGDPADKPSPD